MKLNYLLLLLSFTLVACSTDPHTKPEQNTKVTPAAACSDNLKKGAVAAGDYPDPSVIKVGDTYYATATSSAWAPAYPILTSKDLANWQVSGAVFRSPPAWTKGDYWAPEIAKLSNGYFVYYTARNKTNDRLCVGVATAKRPLGPYKDHGPLVCEEVGSIDGMPVEDENGQKYMFWKEDGNSQQKPTPIWIQKLTPDGTKLVGEKVEVMRNDAPWEGHLIEGPFLQKRGQYWYMYYSGNACCGFQCNYAMGVARAKSLLGPWEKNPANPILKGNDTWKCPGHGSVVTDNQGRDIMMYHAYHAKDFVFVGRQAMVDVVEWGSDDWPTINGGKGPTAHQEFLGVALRNEEHNFSDEFSESRLSKQWQWPARQVPVYRLDHHAGGRLTLVSANSDEVGAVLGRPTTTGDYIATAVVKKPSQPQAVAGISAFGNLDNALGLSVSKDSLVMWDRRGGKTNIVFTKPAPASDTVHLRYTAQGGRQLSFEYSADGRNWSKLASNFNGEHLPPWDLGIRVAIVAGGIQNGTADFESVRVEPLIGQCR